MGENIPEPIPDKLSEAIIMIENTEESFQQHLLLKDLADKTIQQYLIYYRNFQHSEELTQELVNRFVVKYKGNVARAFISTYLEFRNNTEISLPKKTGRKKKRVLKTLTMEEINKLANGFHSANHKFGLMFEVLFEIAIRREELTNMKVGWFNWDAWAEDTTKPCRIGVIGKNNKERILLVSPKLMFKIKDFVQNGLNDGSVSMPKSMFGIGEHRLWEIFKIHSQRILGKRCNPHQIRHTRASMWRDQGVPIDEISRRLGHSSIQTTQIYLHTDEEQMLKSWEREFS